MGQKRPGAKRLVGNTNEGKAWLSHIALQAPSRRYELERASIHIRLLAVYRLS